MAWKPVLRAFALASTALAGGGPAEANPAVLDVPAPELTGGPWLNTGRKTPLTLASRRGKVTIVHFWTSG